MHDQIFVNLPIRDLPRSVKFFESLGYTFNPQFTDENATCMILGENLFAMLLVEPYFRTFIEKDLSDAHRATEVLLVRARAATNSIASGNPSSRTANWRMDAASSALGS